MLSEQNRQRLDGIVQQMIANNESDANIRFVVDDFKRKYDTPAAPAPKKSAGQQILDAATAVTEVLGGKAIADTFGSEIAKIGQPADIKSIISSSQPTPAQTLGSAIQLGAGLLPVGRIAEGITAGARAAGLAKGVSAIGKIGSGTAAGYAFDVGGNLQDNKTGAAALAPGVATVLGGAFPAAAVAKNVTVRFGSNQAPRVVNSLIKPLQKDFSYGKNPGRAVAEEGIVANTFDELAQRIRDRRQEIGQEIGALGNTLSAKSELNIQDALSPLTEAIKEAAHQNNPTVLQRLSQVKTALTDVLEPHVDDEGAIGIKSVGKRNLDKLTFSEVRDVLGEIGDLTKFTGNPSDDRAVNAALKQVYGKVKEASINYAREANPELAAQFEKLTEKYADLHSAEIATKYRDKIAERANLISLSPQLAGIASGLLTAIATGGDAIPAVLVGISGAALDKLASTPAFKTRLAALLSGKTREELAQLFERIPALSKIFPEGGLRAPGDLFLDNISE